ncbi:MAG: SMP-30/gluconolactonase/LRE family protein, partial [Planctomycetales bacterium]|nr:SMP-30/gluconolactonase/LRE family protein [Planctomycetales bacterium]
MGWRSSFASLCFVGVFSVAAFAQDMPLSQVLRDGEDWQLVSEGHTFTEGPAVDREGNVYFTDVRESKIFRVGADGKVELFADNTANTNGLMFGPDGLLYGCRNGDRQIVAYRPDGSFRVVAEGVDSNDLAVNSAGDIYFTDPPNRQVWYVAPSGEKRVVADGFRPNGIILWPDEGTVVVTDSEQPHLWTFRVEADGGLKFGERYYGPLVVPPAPTTNASAPRRSRPASAADQPVVRPGSDG